MATTAFAKSLHWPLDLLQTAAEFLGLRDFFTVFARLSRECRLIAQSDYMRSQIIMRGCMSNDSRVSLSRMNAFCAHVCRKHVASSVLPLVIGDEEKQVYLKELEGVQVAALDVLFVNTHSTAFLSLSPNTPTQRLSFQCAEYGMSRADYERRFSVKPPPWQPPSRFDEFRLPPWAPDASSSALHLMTKAGPSYDFMHGAMPYDPSAAAAAPERPHRPANPVIRVRLPATRPGAIRAQLVWESDSDEEEEEEHEEQQGEDPILALAGLQVADDHERNEHEIETQTTIVRDDAADVYEAAPLPSSFVRVTKRLGLSILPRALQLLQLSNVTLTLASALREALCNIPMVELRDQARIRLAKSCDYRDHRGDWRLNGHEVLRAQWPPFAVSLLKRAWETATYKAGHLRSLVVVASKEHLVRAALCRPDTDDRASAVFSRAVAREEAEGRHGAHPISVAWAKHAGPIVMDADGRTPMPGVRETTGWRQRAHALPSEDIRAMQFTHLTPEQERSFLLRVSASP